MANKRKKDWGAYLYLMPTVVILVAFHVLPIFYSLAVSFYEWDLIGQPEYVGVGNYSRLFDDPMFYKSLWNTVYYAAVSVPLSIFFSLIIAMLLNNPISAIGLYRTIYFIPVITSINAVAIVWNFIYHPDFGLLNKILAIFSIDPRAWLQDPTWAMPAIIFMSVWKGLGHNVIIFLAGLQNIPRHLYEAARIDGASRWQQFRFITWPALATLYLTSTMLSMVWTLGDFNSVYLLTGGGPGDQTHVLATLGIRYLRIDQLDLAMASIVMAMPLVLPLVIFMVRRLAAGEAKLAH